MAYRRCLLIRGNFVDRRCRPSFSYVLHSDEGKHESPDQKSSSAGIGNFTQLRSFGSSFNGSIGFFGSCRDKFHSPSAGYDFCRYMSTLNQDSDKIGMTIDVADVLADSTMETVASQAPVVNEVAIAAADSFLPVQALQLLIDAVHSYTGLNWWASIVLTTLLIRSAAVPLLIYQHKVTSKHKLMRHYLKKIKQQMEEKTMDPVAVAKGQKQMKQLFKEYGVSPYVPLNAFLIIGPIHVSFCLAIRNMAEKVASFKHGGASWFIDLSTPDAFYILPNLAVLSFLITIECVMQDGVKGNPMVGIRKNVWRGLAVLAVLFAVEFPKATHCYWITSNLFSLIYGLVLKDPGVKKSLGIPVMRVAAPTSAPQSPFSIFPALKQATSTTNRPSSVPDEASKHSNNKISSSSVISQRVRSLEKQLKERMKDKK